MKNPVTIDNADPAAGSAATSVSPRRARRRPPRRFLLIALTVVGLLHAYVGFRLLPALHLDIGALVSAAVLLAVSTLLIPLSLASPLYSGRLPKFFETALVWGGLIATGLASSLLVLTLLRDLLLLPAALWLGSGNLQVAEHDSAWAVFALAVVLTLIGLFNARHAPRIVEVDVPLASLPPALHGFRIAQISDLHVGPTIKRAFLQRIVEQVNTLDAHVVAITGDLVDGSVAELSRHTEALQGLRSTHGSFFVTGNHEYYSGADAWVRELRRLGITVLQNAHVSLQHAGASLLVAGVTDYSAHRFGEQHRSDPQAAAHGAPATDARILLAHQPRSAPAAAAAGFQLQLSGHTHGGQFFPWNLFVPLQQPFTAGLHRLDDLWVYTSRGTGYWGPPKRLGAPAEITLLRLVPAA